MTDMELDKMMRRVLVDAVCRDYEAIEAENLTFVPSNHFKYQMKNMLKNPQNWESRTAKRVWVAALVAIMIIVLSATALAASGVLSNVIKYINIHGGQYLTVEQEEMIQQELILPNQSVTNDGVTFTLNEVYGDGVDFWFALQMECDQKSIPDAFSFEEYDILVDGDPDGHIFMFDCDIDSNQPADDHLRNLTIHMRRDPGDSMAVSERILNGSIRLENVIAWLDSSQWGDLDHFDTISKGVWKFDFRLDGRHSMDTMSVSDFTLEGNAALNSNRVAQAKVVSITMRTMGMELLYRTDPLNGCLDLPTPVLWLKDGTEVFMHERSGGYVEENNGSNGGLRNVTFQLEGPVQIDQIRAICFDGQELLWCIGE